MDPMTKVSVRDFAIFQLKLLIDGFKDGAVFAMSFVAFGVDLVFRRHGRRRGFYRMMMRSSTFGPISTVRRTRPKAMRTASSARVRREATQCWVRSSRSFEGAMNRLSGRVRRLRRPKVDRRSSV